MNTKKQFGLKTFLTLSLFALISCSNLIQQNNDSSQQDKPSADGNTYLVIKSATLKQTSRSAQNNFGPGLADAKLENLVDLKIFSISDSGTEKKIVEAETYEKLIEKTIPVEPGNWKFKLTAELMGVPFSGTTPVEIKAGVENSVSFTLTSDVLSGKLSFTVSWANAEENSNANKIKVILKKAVSPLSQDNEPAIVTKVIEAEDITDKSASVKIDKLDNGNELSGGTYYLQLKFYNEGTEAALNTTEYYVSIINGLTTYADLEVNLKETFKITYEANDGELASGAVQPLNCFSQLSEDITLPAMTKPGYFWGGWYDNEDFTGEAITKIPASSDKNWTVYAKWNEPAVYVSGTGDDTTGDGTEANPFESIDKACEEIIATGDSEMAWTIYIIGDVTGPHSSHKKAGDRSSTSNDYGRSVIPNTLTLSHAKSLLLIGYNGLDENEIPKDKINRGLADTSSNYDTGTALGIATEVPVTIKNLLIIGGRTATTNGNSDNDPFFTYGGGIHVKAESTVTLDDGTLIEKNKARYGGGVYNAGTLYLVGTACIGDRNATILAVRGSYDTCSNESTYAGGGIYNVGTLYLGTEEKVLEGGIYYNCGLTIWGGGIYNTENGTIIMNSGNIAYNDGQEHCGGIEVVSGSLTMTGGSIHHNSTGGKGGGILLKPGAIFNFSGGTISANWATGGGGGVYIDSSESTPSIMYMYGTAVIGDKTKTSAPTSREGANGTNGNGAGICINGGRLYMGYKSYTSESDNEPADLSGGIFYNYCTSSNNESKGGGIYASGSQGQPKTSDSENAYVRIHSGTIANNYADKGSAICTPSGAHPLVIGGSVKIPSGSDHKHDVFIYGNYNRLFIEDSLEEITADDPIYITLSDSDGISYYSSAGLMLAQNATIESIGDVIDKFAVTPLINKKNGLVTQWIIVPDTGNVVQNTSSLYVSSTNKGGSDDNDGLSASTPLASIQAAINKMDDETKDYIIYLNTLDSELNVPQTILDPENGSIKANSIKIVGKNVSSNYSYLPKDILNGNFGESQEGSTLTIDTSVPVTLYGILIKGGHGTVQDGKIVGGGLLLREGAYVYLENNTRILGNTVNYTGATLPGYGAGVYIPQNAKLLLKDSHITENIGTEKGAGAYVCDGGLLKMLSGSYITLNTFDKSFKNQDGAPINVYGAGVYLEDNATLEMVDGYINVNTANAAEGAKGYGNGVYVSNTTDTPAQLKMGGSARVALVNDVYLQNNAQIEVIEYITTTTSAIARITPEFYPNNDENIYLIKMNNETSSRTLYWSNVASNFEIIPQELSNGEKQYWFVDSANEGKLSKQTGSGVSVSIPNGISDDNFVVTVKKDGELIKDSFTINVTKGIETTLVFEATELADLNYCWTVDNEDYCDGTYCEIETKDWLVGSYTVYLTANDDEYDNVYSYTAQITVNAN